MKDATNIGMMEKQLTEWGAKLDDLVTQADAVGTGAKEDYRKRIDDLKAKYQNAHSRLDEFKASGSEKLEIMESGLESAWKELEVAFKTITKNSE